MSYTVPPQLDDRIRAMLETGRYRSADDVLDVALALLEDRDAFYEHRLEKLREELQVGLDQLDRGESVPLDVQRIQREGKELLAKRQQGKRVHVTSPS